MAETRKHAINCLKSQAYGTGCSCAAELSRGAPEAADYICICGAPESEHGGAENWCPAKHEDAVFSTKQKFFAAACKSCKGTGSRLAETADEYIRANCESCRGSGFATKGMPMTDRAELITQRIENCGWATIHDRDQFVRNLRVAMESERETGHVVLLEALRLRQKHGHVSGCGIYRAKPCDCGFVEAEAAIEQAEGKC